jgi:hypothetical protein
MARTVIYGSAMERAHLTDVLAEGTDKKPTSAARHKAADRAAKKVDPNASKEELAQTPNSDGYLSKIAKYVPAETVTLTLAAFAAFKPDGNTVWVFLAVGALANVVYLLSLASNEAVAQRPRAYFYALSVLAFLGWSIAVIEFVQTKVGLNGDDADAQKAFVLAATAFLVPALDSILGKLKIDIGN